MANQDINGLVTGLSNGLNSYLGMQQKVSAELSMNKQKSDLELQNAKDLSTFKQSQEGELTPDMAKNMFSQVSPAFGDAAYQSVSDFSKANGRNMKMSEAEKYLDPIMKIFSAKSDQSKHIKDQNTMFEKMKGAVMSSRGDPALSDIAKQQTALGLGYRTLADVRQGKMKLSPAVWTDVMGQLWKGRTGGVPPQEVMKSLEQGNVVEAFRITLNKLSGYELNQDVQPNVVIDNMLDFLKNTGDDVDQRYKDLMSVHLVRDPAFEDDKKYNELVDSVNKRSFAGFTQDHQGKVTDIRNKEASPTGIVGTEGQTKKGTKFKVLGPAK